MTDEASVTAGEETEYGSGYGGLIDPLTKTPIFYFVPGQPSVAGMSTRVTVPSETVINTRTWVPETEYVPPTGNPMTIRNIANLGWDTWARSIDPITVGNYFDFTAMGGITGACLALGPKNSDGKGIHLFSHSMMIDTTGVYAYEKGVYKNRLRTSHNPVTNLRIYRQPDNTIVYVATTATETVVYTSLSPVEVAPFTDLYVYGHLYASDDKITAAAYKTGEVQYGSV